MDDGYCLDDLSGRRFALLDLPLSRVDLLASLRDPLETQGIFRGLRGEIEPARRALERARASHMRRGASVDAARVACHLVPVLTVSGAYDAAIARLEEACRFEALDPVRLAYLCGWRGLIARARGASREAISELGRARARYEELGATRAVAVLTVHLGELAHEANDPRALEILEQAATLARRCEDPILLAWAISSLSLAQPNTANALLEEARALTDHLASGLGDLLTLREAIQALDTARCGPCPPASTVRCAETTLATTSRRAPRIATLETRFARRQLERALAGYRTILSEGLRYDATLTYLELETGVRIDLSRRTRLRTVLKVLIEERIANPGHALTVYELFERSWPDDRSSPESAANRTYVAIARLRKLGLGGAIKTSSDGFLLDPSVPLGSLEAAPSRALAS